MIVYVENPKESTKKKWEKALSIINEFIRITGHKINVWKSNEVYTSQGINNLTLKNMCTPVADSCWCMAKPIQYCKVSK